VDPAKVSYEQMRENYLAHCAEDKDPPMCSLTKDRDGNPTLPTLPRVDAFFGGWKAADITTDVIRRFRRGGKQDGLSDKRMNRYVATLSAMFHWSAKDGKITAAEMPAYFPKTPEKNEAVGAIFIKPEWYRPLREELEEPLRSAFTLAYHVSIRVYEMRRLRWRDVDPNKSIITLPGSITKTGKQRIVPLPSDFDLNPGKADDLVFPLGDIREVWRAATVKVGAGWFECRECGARCEGHECPTHGKRWLRGMQYKGLLLRHTRHTAARNLVDAGLDRDRAKAITGHLTDSVFSRYNIGKDSEVENARKALEQFHRATQKKRKG
jgi:hypothetical protein